MGGLGTNAILFRWSRACPYDRVWFLDRFGEKNPINEEEMRRCQERR